ncbi:MAG TPA: PP2C family serine/threonine-protein phosphatase [Bryobacteraceae bacterium]|nr:PP2C family serine/threonine-protein phosphatase [Bryobacteraceae bacterium]
MIGSERKPTLEAWGASDPGLVRQNNEDSWALDPALHVAIVADGMGGALCGEVASAMAVETILEQLRAHFGSIPPEQAIDNAIQEANRRVFERSRADQSCAGMGSTVVVVWWDLPRIIIANVGDSRAYLWREGAITQISYDQTLVNELRVRFGLSEEEVCNFPHKNVLTHAVGTSAELLIRRCEEKIVPGDVVLLCSDGLTGPVSDQSIAQTLSRDNALPSQISQLINLAKAGGAPDNVTCVLLRYNDWQI